MVHVCNHYISFEASTPGYCTLSQGSLVRLCAGLKRVFCFFFSLAATFLHFFGTYAKQGDAEAKLRPHRLCLQWWQPVMDRLDGWAVSGKNSVCWKWHSALLLPGSRCGARTWSSLGAARHLWQVLVSSDITPRGADADPCLALGLRAALPSVRPSVCCQNPTCGNKIWWCNMLLLSPDTFKSKFTKTMLKQHF